jgi:glycine hydroxymethyltransferase
VSDFYSVYRQIMELNERHNREALEQLHLIASENSFSPSVGRILASDLGNRVAEGWAGQRYYPGIEQYEAIERMGLEAVRDVLGAEFVDPRPISGTLANLIVYRALTKPGDRILSLKISDGGHVSMAGSTPRMAGLKVDYLPFSPETFQISASAAVDQILRSQPALVVLGGSVILFPQPVREIVTATRQVGGIVLYDASHVIGLTIGGVFQNPLAEGADVLTFSTCKTLPGPQHAFICSKNEYAESIKKATFPGLVSGHHLHETVAAFVAFLEMAEYGADYASQTVANARALGTALSIQGVDVLAAAQGYTDTHMILLRPSAMTAAEAERLLESVNIICNRNLLPGDKSPAHASGLRLGSQEVTHLGMREDDMSVIAELIADTLSGRSERKAVCDMVVNFRKDFQRIQYCFDEEAIQA